ncbi:MFS transporter [Chloroflexota bacterium]
MQKKGIFYGWWLVIAGGLINAVGIGIAHQCFTVFFLPVKRDLGLSSAAVSLVYGASRLEGGAEGPLVGYLIDRLGPRKIILVGATLTGIGFLLLSRVDSFVTFLLAYVLVISLGANAGFYHPVSAAVNSWFIRYRAVTFAIISASISFGGMVMAPVLSYIILNYSWRTAAVIAGFIILIVSLPLAMLIHRSPEERGLLPDGKPPPSKVTEQTSAAERTASEVDFTVKEALRTFAYWLLTLCISVRILVTMALTAHFVPILVWKGMSEATAAYLLSLFYFGSILVMLVMGWIGDRWKKPFMCSLAMLTTFGCILVVVFGQTTIALYFFPIGLAIAMGSVPLNWSLIGDFFGRRSYATLRGIMGVSYGTATFLSPIYAGWIFDRTGSYTMVLISFSVILLLGAILFAVLRRPTRIKAGGMY